MATTRISDDTSALEDFHPVLRRWFCDSFPKPTRAQTRAWPIISSGKSTLLLAPTGSGKTLAAFLVAINRLMFQRRDADAEKGVRVLYISPLKALGVDVERNLRSPLVGVRVAAEREGVAYRLPTVGVRSGDTPAADRDRLRRQPPDILITTPESLYLILTSRARDILATADTVIVDEIHSLVATKRGVHLFVSLERLEALRGAKRAGCAPTQRIGLSATQRPLEEIARLLAGAQASGDADEAPRPRAVEIVEATEDKRLELTIEVPVEDMAGLSRPQQQTGPAAAGPSIPSIWPSIHPRLVQLIREHRSTMIFVNSRRLAERLSAAINELADEELALAHHGSIAKEARRSIEDRLKRGELRAIVATSSLELGIDMGAVDLVVQIEAPPSIASGIQRIGRAGHQVGTPSRGIIIPKYRGDLLACSAATERMVQGRVEETHYPRNPLDVLAQQVVAMAALEPVPVDELYRTVRCAAPFHQLPRSLFDGVLDLLSGRYPSNEFAELRPRVTWDRLAGQVAPRKGTQRIAVLNGGTIPDRGLYGVYLAEDGRPGSRVGELDEEMVFETRAGDVFLLGASSWQVREITHDRVLVAPAPGQPGKMPFWRGDGPGRPLEFGRAIGSLSRRLLAVSREQAIEELTARHALDPRAAKNLIDYLYLQAEATEDVPSDRTIVVERFLDEVGDWRVVVLSPYGARVHAPWATAVAARLRSDTSCEVDLLWSDDGMMFRLPESDQPPPVESLIPAPEEVQQLVTRELASTALFAARFRENAGRALLLPRRQPNRRTPLWLQRRRASDLLSVASRYPDFPILLETYRECLRDVFDLQGLTGILEDVQRRAIRVRVVDSQTASPFAASLLFNYTANFIYDGDAPLAERRAQTLSLDHSLLRELLGDAQMRELLDAATVDQVGIELQRLDERYRIGHIDALEEMLRALGDLSRDELAARCRPDAVASGQMDQWIDQLLTARRIIGMRIAGEPRMAVAEDASRLRDALGVVPPPGLPDAFLQAVEDPLGDLVSRYARTHVPFRAEDVAVRFGLGTAPVRHTLERLAARNRVLEGEFLPGGRGREWCDAEVLRRLKRQSLAHLRKQIEPVTPQALGRFLIRWQGLAQPRRGLDGLLDAIHQLQGLPLPLSALEQHVLPARVRDYRSADLDELCAAGEILWRGYNRLGPSDGRIALYLTDDAPNLLSPPQQAEGERCAEIRELLGRRGAIFFEEIAEAIGGFRNELLDALWELVWSGEVANDTLVPLRLRFQNRQHRSFRSRRRGSPGAGRHARLPGSEGRWSLLERPQTSVATSTERQAAVAAQLIDRYGILTREMVSSEGIAGGFSGLYPVLKAMEEAGKLRRGYFVSGLGAAQFAAPGADQRLRDEDRREEDDDLQRFVLAATDPASPYGTALPWPQRPGVPERPQRASGAMVILHNGALVGYMGRTASSLISFLPDEPPRRAEMQEILAQMLATIARPGAPVFLTKIDGGPPGDSPLAPVLLSVGFTATSRGYLHRGYGSEQNSLCSDPRRWGG